METSTQLASAQSKRAGTARTVLNLSGQFGFIVIVIGQWIFALYIAGFYGGKVIAGDIAGWNEVIPHGYVPGDIMGNLAVAAHLLLAIVLFVGGPMQFVSGFRRRFPTVHRWNGKLYLVSAITTALGGLYMVWTRGTVGGLFQHLSISLNAILIVGFAVLAWRFAMKRRFDVHQRWVLRLFMVVSGVWFFRVGLMLWLMIHQAPVGFDPDTFQGPFLNFLGVAQYTLPLVVLELYFAFQKRGSTGMRYALSSLLVLITVGIAMGIFAATMGMWLPRL